MITDRQCSVMRTPCGLASQERQQIHAVGFHAGCAVTDAAASAVGRTSSWMIGRRSTRPRDRALQEKRTARESRFPRLTFRSTSGVIRRSIDRRAFHRRSHLSLKNTTSVRSSNLRPDRLHHSAIASSMADSIAA
jgi:hypothetical protein